MPDRDPSKPPTAVPNVRGEDESELQYLVSIIETLSWQLTTSPTKHPSVLLGRHPKSAAPASAFVAAVYGVAKGGAKSLEVGPEVGGSRREVLGRLLEVVEGEVGRTILRDGRRREGGGVGVVGESRGGGMEGRGRGDGSGMEGRTRDGGGGTRRDAVVGER